MAIIVYEKKTWESKITSLSNKLQNRYNFLKTELQKNQQQTAAFNKIKNQLIAINSAYAYLTQDQLETAISNAADLTLSEALERAIGDIRMLHVSKSPGSQKILNAIYSLQTLNGLFEAAKVSGGISIDLAGFQKMQTKVQNLVYDKNFSGFSEIGNMIGQLGATVGEVQTQKALLEINKILNIQTPQMQITEVGASKRDNTNTTVTTDSIVIPGLNIKSMANGVSASLNISSKLNVNYKANSKTTKTPVKMASRNVITFLNEVESKVWRSGYEQAIYNFISFHRNKAEAPHIRFNYALGKRQSNSAFSEAWSVLRRSVSAEILYNMLRSTNYTFSLNGNKYNDRVTIYNYGDKLFLEDKIATSAFARNDIGEVQFPNISNIQQQLLSYEGARKVGYEIHGGKVLVKNEGEAENIISKTSIVYNQKINF